MNPERKLKCVVSGSFRKFKQEIDTAIDEFTDYGVIVLAPDKGWLYIPPHKLYTLDDINFRPLPTEVDMSVRQIEDNFLDALSKSDFVYVVNPNGYVGNTVSMEIGFAIGLGKPVYSQEPITPNLDIDPMWRERISNVKDCTIQEAIKEIKSE